MTHLLLSSPMYQETAALVIGFLFVMGVAFYPFRDNSTHSLAAWAGLKSWIFFGPFLFILAGFSYPWPIFLLGLFGISACKGFFQMTGMYHRSWFVWVTYFFVAASTYMIYQRDTTYYDMMPMLFLGTLSLIPIVRNSSKRMIQYIALSLMGFVFFGWSFLHLGRMLLWEKGVFIVVYVFILAEIADNASVIGSLLLGKHKVASLISTRTTYEGLLFSVALTTLAAWGLRHLLPIRTEPYWLAAGLATSIVGVFGDLFLCTIRRDLGIKSSGLFIIGRGDIIDRMDKLIFIAPVLYYVVNWLGIPERL